MLQFSAGEREDLEALVRSAKEPHVRMKAVALWNLARGRTQRDVGEFLGVSSTSLGAWAKRYQAHGAAGLAIQPGRGRKARADPAEVRRYLCQEPRAFGLRQTRWTLRALAETAPSLRGFSDMGVWKVLQRMGLRYKRGQPYLRSPDPRYEEKRGLWNRPCVRLLQAGEK